MVLSAAAITSAPCASRPSRGAGAGGAPAAAGASEPWIWLISALMFRSRGAGSRGIPSVSLGPVRLEFCDKIHQSAWDSNGITNIDRNPDSGYPRFLWRSEERSVG